MKKFIFLIVLTFVVSPVYAISLMSGDTPCSEWKCSSLEISISDNESRISMLELELD